MVEDTVKNQQVFIMGGYDLGNKLLNDEGYFMYDIATNYMHHIDSFFESFHIPFSRYGHTINTLKLPLSNSETITFCKNNGLKLHNFRHYIYGGVVQSKEHHTIKNTSSDLFVVDQMALIESEYIK